MRLKTFALIVALAVAPSLVAADPLPSWREGEARQRLLAFVAAVTEEDGERFVAPEDRIAVFDNDGTLWVEKPTYTQVYFVLDRLDRLAPQHPEWRTTQPYQAALERNLGGLGVPDLLKLVGATHAGMTQAEFEAEAARFFATARHARWKRPYQELVYQPQLELLDLLRANDFRVFIVTGGGRDFVRSVSEPVYDVPRHMVVGSAIQTEFEGEVRLRRLAEIVKPVNDKAGKPVNIAREIGRRPILAVGNSDGDLEMMQYSAGHGARSLQVLIHHDDAEREYAYDHGAEKALAAVAEHGWVRVDMKRDFGRVFPFDAR